MIAIAVSDTPLNKVVLLADNGINLKAYVAQTLDSKVLSVALSSSGSFLFYTNAAGSAVVSN